MQIFSTAFDYRRFLNSVLYYQIEGPKPKFSLFKVKSVKLDNNKKIVDIICYCLMPNHFHFLLQQKKEGCITEFMAKLSNSYTKYFNTKNKRIGPLLQGEFQSVHVGSNEQLVHLSRYIHLNPLIGYITKDLNNYRWSSYLEYLGLAGNNICSKEIILDQFKSLDDYKQFVLDQIGYARELDTIKHQLLDLEE